MLHPGESRWVDSSGDAGPASAAAGMRALRKAIDAVKTGVSAAGPVLGIGGSTVRGPNGVHAQSFMTQLVAQLNAASLPASIDSVFGVSNLASPAAFITADPRVFIGVRLDVSGVRTASGACFEFPANTAPTAWAFTPASGAA